MTPTTPSSSTAADARHRPAVPSSSSNAQYFPHTPQVRPAGSSNVYWESWLAGGRRIVLLYVVLALLLYARSMRNVPKVAAQRVCKEVHFIRHGEALHNRDARLFADFYQGRHLSPVYHDAPLTDAGHEQGKRLNALIQELKEFKPQLIVSSTLTRALQTARAAFPHPLPILATDSCRERIATYASDRRRPISQVKEEFPGVDFTLVEEEHDIVFDFQKEVHPDPYDSHLCKERARKFVDWLLHERKEESIVVVTHWVFLSHLLKAEGLDNQPTFENAEMRAVNLCRQTQ